MITEAAAEVKLSAQEVDLVEKFKEGTQPLLDGATQPISQTYQCYLESQSTLKMVGIRCATAIAWVVSPTKIGGVISNTQQRKSRMMTSARIYVIS